MKNLVDLLRQADPLDDDMPPLDEARDRIRQRVVGTAVVASRPFGSRRKGALAAVAALLISLAVAWAAVVGSGERGAVHAAVRFEVRLAETQPIPGLIVARVGTSARTIYLHPDTIATNDDIAQSWVMPDGSDQFSVSVQLFEQAAQRMRQATAGHIGRPLAIVHARHLTLLLPGRLWAAIRSRNQLDPERRTSNVRVAVECARWRTR